jgi:hypothetical protein
MSALGRISKNLLSPFGFLFAKSSAEDRIAAYVIREHDRGRAIDAILDDSYVKNRLKPAEIERVIERPDVLRHIGDDMAEAAREALAQLKK